MTERRPLPRVAVPGETRIRPKDDLDLWWERNLTPLFARLATKYGIDRAPLERGDADGTVRQPGRAVDSEAAK